MELEQLHCSMCNKVLSEYDFCITFNACDICCNIWCIQCQQTHNNRFTMGNAGNYCSVCHTIKDAYWAQYWNKKDQSRK